MQECLHKPQHRIAWCWFRVMHDQPLIVKDSSLRLVPLLFPLVCKMITRIKFKPRFQLMFWTGIRHTFPWSRPKISQTDRHIYIFFSGMAVSTLEVYYSKWWFTIEIRQASSNKDLNKNKQKFHLVFVFTLNLELSMSMITTYSFCQEVICY